MNRRRAAALAAVVLVLAVAVAAWRGAARTPLQSATRMLPADTLRGSWTDWAGVRREVGATLDSSSSGEEVQAFLDRAFEAELTGSSALPGSAVTMQDEMGFSPATAEWELFAQSRAGAAVLLRLQSLDGVGERLRDLGYTEPAEETGVWRGGPDLLASIDGTLTPELQYVALVESENLVVTSDKE